MVWNLFSWLVFIITIAYKMQLFMSSTHFDCSIMLKPNVRAWLCEYNQLPTGKHLLRPIFISTSSVIDTSVHFFSWTGLQNIQL